MNNRMKIFLMVILYAMTILYGYELVIPEGTTEIRIAAYRNRKDITSVVIPNSVTSIGNSAFNGCSSLTNIVIPNSVTSIGTFAFCDCTALTSVVISNSVTSIGQSTFLHCSSLTSVVIPDSVTSIDIGAFYGSGLTSMTIPSSVTLAYTSCFDKCENLKILTINCDGTAIHNNTTNGILELNSLTDVYFNNGMPSEVWSFANGRRPTIHGSLTWNGYELKDIAAERPENQTIPLPTTSGKVGQVLMVTPNGYEWKDVPGGYSAAIADSFHLDAGWNLISLPEAELTASCKEELLKAYYFFTFDKDAKTYARVNELIPRGCYWIFVKEACTIHFTKAE